MALGGGDEAEVGAQRFGHLTGGLRRNGAVPSQPGRIFMPLPGVRAGAAAPGALHPMAGRRAR